MIKYLNKENFASTLEENKVVLVDFYADWCGPCNSLSPILEKLSEEFADKAVIAKVNVDQEPELSSSLGVRSIPALFYFKDAELTGSQVGLQLPKALSDKLHSLIEN